MTNELRTVEVRDREPRVDIPGLTRANVLLTLIDVVSWLDKQDVVVLANLLHAQLDSSDLRTVTQLVGCTVEGDVPEGERRLPESKQRAARSDSLLRRASMFYGRRELTQNVFDDGPVEISSDGKISRDVASPIDRMISGPAPRRILREVYSLGAAGYVWIGGTTAKPEYTITEEGRAFVRSLRFLVTNYVDRHSVPDDEVLVVDPYGAVLAPRTARVDPSMPRVDEALQVR